MNRYVADAPLSRENRVVNVMSSIVRTDQIWDFIGHEGRGHTWGIGQQYLRGMVVKYRIGKHRELGHVCTGVEGILIEARAGDRIDLETRSLGPGYFV